MRRVVVTGMGIVSSIGNDCHEVLNSLRNGTSGIEACPEYAECSGGISGTDRS